MLNFNTRGNHNPTAPRRGCNPRYTGLEVVPLRSPSESKLPNHPLRDPCLHVGMNQRQGHSDLPMGTLTLPPTILWKSACPDDADRREAHLLVRARMLVVHVGGHEGVKHACEPTHDRVSHHHEKKGYAPHAPRGPAEPTKKSTVRFGNPQ